MKKFLTKYFGMFGMLIYILVAFIIRIPVYFILSGYICTKVLLFNAITGSNESSDGWLENLFDWYRYIPNPKK